VGQSFTAHTPLLTATSKLRFVVTYTVIDISQQLSEQNLH